MPTGVYVRTKSKPRKPRINRNCEVCGKTFEVLPSALKHRMAKYCSQKCMGTAQKKEGRFVELNCDFCGREFSKRKDHLKQNNFCSAQCSNAKRRQPDSKWNNPEKIAEYMRTYSVNNRETLNAKARGRDKRNPESAKACRKRWSDKNKTKRAIYSQNRRAKIVGNGGEFSESDWEALLKFYNYTCLRCGRREPQIKLTADHVIAVSNGGSNCISNIQPLCQSCNTSKGVWSVDYRLKSKGWPHSQGTLDCSTQTFEGASSARTPDYIIKRKLMLAVYGIEILET